MELLSSTGNTQQHAQDLPKQTEALSHHKGSACTGGHRADSLSPADSGKLSWLTFRWGL